MNNTDINNVVSELKKCIANIKSKQTTNYYEISEIAKEINYVAKLATEYNFIPEADRETQLKEGLFCVMRMSQKLMRVLDEL